MSTSESLQVKNDKEDINQSTGEKDSSYLKNSEESVLDLNNTKDTSENSEQESFNTSHSEIEENISISNEIKKYIPNERSMFYKKPISKDNYRLEVDFDDSPQEIRRQKLLEHQKKCRDAIINEKRGLVDAILGEERESEEIEQMEEQNIPEEVEGMECQEIKNKKIRKRKISRYYAKLTQLSEWMFDVPQDLNEKWIMVPCPVGKRSLIVASRGLTKSYTRRGLLKGIFQSGLPGGNKRFSADCTLLDCVYSYKDKTFYVLDVLALANHEMINCEAECRFFWLENKLKELEGLNKKCRFKFATLQKVTCTQDLCELMHNLPESFDLDGIIFFHKEGHYIHGTTPLVTWLKPYMLPEVLGMNIPERFCETPLGYIDFEHNMNQIKENKLKKRNWRQKRESPEKLEIDEVAEPEPEAMQ